MLKASIQNSSPNSSDLIYLAGLFESDDQNISRTHYELAIIYPDTTPEAWSEFLKHPDVVIYIDDQVKLIRNANLRKLETNGNLKYSQVQHLEKLQKKAKEDDDTDNRVKIIVMDKALFSKYKLGD
jgi:hypothetical protein